MRDLYRMLQMTVLLTATLAALSCRAPERASSTTASPGDRSVDEAAIRQLMAANETAANKHDAAGVAATYANDADIIAFAGGRIAGRDSIRQPEEAFFSGTPQVQFAANIRTIRFVTGDVAIVEADSVHRFPERETRERATLVVVRHDGAWSLAAVRVMPLQQQADMFSSDLPPASGSSPAQAGGNSGKN